MDSNAVFAVILLIVGLSILTAEIFIPSGGLLGVITFLSLLVSLIFAYRAWGVSHPNLFGGFCLLLLILVPTVIGTGLYLLPRTPLGKKVLLEAPESENVTPYLEESRRLEKLVGRFGVALTILRPGGLVDVDGTRLHAVSEGLMVEAGESIEIINVRGSQVVVRPGNAPQDFPDQSVQSAENPTGLDFEYPSS